MEYKFTLKGKLLEGVQRVKGVTNCATEAEAIRDALVVYFWVVEQYEKGISVLPNLQQSEPEVTRRLTLVKSEHDKKTD